jgi:hypothetical protein
MKLSVAVLLVVDWSKVKASPLGTGPPIGPGAMLNAAPLVVSEADEPLGAIISSGQLPPETIFMPVPLVAVSAICELLPIVSVGVIILNGTPDDTVSTALAERLMEPIVAGPGGQLGELKVTVAPLPVPALKV